MYTAALQFAESPNQNPSGSNHPLYTTTLQRNEVRQQGFRVARQGTVLIVHILSATVEAVRMVTTAASHPLQHTPPRHIPAVLEMSWGLMILLPSLISQLFLPAPSRKHLALAPLSSFVGSKFLAVFSLTVLW